MKGTAPAEILGAIVRAARGQLSVSPEVMTGLVKDLSEQLQRQEIATSERLAKADRIDRVVEGRGRSMVYQPIVELDGHRAIGMEALARFVAEGETWPIPRWFAEASEVGMGTELELACNRAALADLEFIPPDRYVSIKHVVPDRGVRRAPRDPRLRRRLEGGHRDHRARGLEDYDRLTTSLQRVRERGARVAIDDAGAGFASLRHILLIDPEIIKLDVSLTSGIDSDARRRALATALITFAEEMEIAVVAEGIETELEHAALQALGVRFGQGYFIGRPEPLSV